MSSGWDTAYDTNYFFLKDMNSIYMGISCFTPNMYAVRYEWENHGVVKAQKGSLVEVFSCFDNYPYSFRYFLYHIFDMIGPIQFIINYNTQEFSFIYLIYFRAIDCDIRIGISSIFWSKNHVISFINIE